VLWVLPITNQPRNQPDTGTSAWAADPATDSNTQLPLPVPPQNNPPQKGEERGAWEGPNLAAAAGWWLDLCILCQDLVKCFHLSHQKQSKAAHTVTSPVSFSLDMFSLSHVKIHSSLQLFSSPSSHHLFLVLLHFFFFFFFFLWLFLP